jgi:hypothetical protein
MRKFTPFLLLLAAVIAFSFSAKKGNKVDTSCSFWTIDRWDSITAWTFTSDSTLAREPVFVRDNNYSCDGLAFCSVKKKARLVMMVNEEPSQKASLYTTPGKPVLIPVAAPANVLGSLGGYGDVIYTYLHDYTVHTYNLVLIRNGQLDTIVRLTGKECFLAGDIAVDSLGRAWVIVTGNSDRESLGPHELRCYSPGGRLETTVPVQGISRSNAYAMMLVNGKFYVGFGTDNQHFHNRLVRLDLSGGVLKPGRSTWFHGYATDFASPHPGVPSFPKSD